MSPQISHNIGLAGIIKQSSVLAVSAFHALKSAVLVVKREFSLPVAGWIFNLAASTFYLLKVVTCKVPEIHTRIQ